MINEEKLMQEAIITLQEILKFDTVEAEAKENMPFGEGNAMCLNYSLGVMESLGFTTTNLDNFVGYGDYGKGDLFGILCHLDVVPVSSGWTYPPFSATIANGKVYARGALDNKGPFVAVLYAIKKLINENHNFNKKVRIILGCDEESGWKCMERYNKTEEKPSLGFSPDADFPVINCEKGLVHYSLTMEKPQNIFQFESGTRANIVPDSAEILMEYDHKTFLKAVHLGITAVKIDDKMQLSTSGKSAHASTPHEGENALIKLLEGLTDNEHFKIIYDAFYDHLGKGCGLDFPYKYHDYLTLNLGSVKIKENQIIFELDVRHPIDKKKEEILMLLQKGLQFMSIKIPHYHEPLYVDKNHPLVVTLLKAYEEVTGECCEAKTIGGGTYARTLPVGVAFGPIFPNEGSTIHQKDECISIENFDKLIAIYYNAIKKLTF